MNAAEPVKIIKPATGWQWPHPGKIWAYRYLLFMLVWRQFKVRYKQTALGVIWLVLYPLIQVVAYTLVFRYLLQAPSDDIWYPLFVLSGIATWQYFNQALLVATRSLVQYQFLLTSVSVPPLIPLLAALTSNLVEAGITFGLLLGCAWFYGFAPSPRLLGIPLVFLSVTMTAAVIGLWLGPLNARYRDVQQGLQLALRPLFFLSPVVYSVQAVPPGWPETLYYLNPLVSILDGVRWIFFGYGHIRIEPVLLAVGGLGLLLVTGLAHFQRACRRIPDVL